MQVGVASMTEYIKLYRPEHSWLHAFTAFRLPSPLSASDEAESAASASVTACLRSFTKEAALLWAEAFRELKVMLPRAETYYLNGFHTRAAWGRAAAEWPEFTSGRRLVEMFLAWKTSSGNLERRFRRVRRIRCPSRHSCLTSQSKTAWSWSRRRLAKYCARCRRRFRMLARAGIRDAVTSTVS